MDELIRRLVAVLVASAVLAPTLPARAGGVQQLVATAPNRYLAPYAVVTADAPVNLVNVDIAEHDVVAIDATRPDGSAPWCVGRLPGRCPLFFSELITLGVTPVLGLEDAEPGVPYAFHCTVHPWMVGELVVLP